MKRFIISLISTFTLLLAFSCARMEEMGTRSYADGESVQVDFTLEVENPFTETRSTYKPATLNKITTVNVWVYQDGALLQDYSFYKSNYASDPHLPMMFPSSTGSYNVYIFANVGDLMSSAPDSEANIGTVAKTIGDYSSFVAAGFPMANSILNYVPSGGETIKVKRLVGVYDISLSQDSDKITWTATGGRMHNVAKTVRPFGTLDGFSGYASKATSASEVNPDGDFLSSADITALNNGESIQLYFLENCQGNLCPDNTDWKSKIAPDGVKDYCTYITISCSASTPTAEYSNIDYNFYLGQNSTTDFSIKRSTHYSFSLGLSSDVIPTSEDWFVEPEEPDVKRTLRVSTKQPYNGSANTATINSLGWGHTCPDCGAEFGSDAFHLQISTTHPSYGDVYRVHCTCGFNSSQYAFNGASGSNKYNHYIKDYSTDKIVLFDFTKIQLYVVTDLKWNDTWRAYIKSSGTTSGNGFSVSRTAGAGASVGSAVEAVNIITVTDNNPTIADPASFSNATDIIDTLIIESYDGLIHYAYPIKHRATGIPISFQPSKKGFIVGHSSEDKGIILYVLLNNLGSSARYEYHRSSQNDWVYSYPTITPESTSIGPGNTREFEVNVSPDNYNTDWNYIRETNQYCRQSLLTNVMVGNSNYIANDKSWYGLKWNATSWYSNGSRSGTLTGSIEFGVNFSSPYMYNSDSEGIKLYLDVYKANLNSISSTNNSPWSRLCELNQSLCVHSYQAKLYYDIGAYAAGTTASRRYGERFNSGIYESYSYKLESSGYWEFIPAVLTCWYKNGNGNYWFTDKYAITQPYSE